MHPENIRKGRRRKRTRNNPLAYRFPAYRPGSGFSLAGLFLSLRLRRRPHRARTGGAWPEAGRTDFRGVPGRVARHGGQAPAPEHGRAPMPHFRKKRTGRILQAETLGAHRFAPMPHLPCSKTFRRKSSGAVPVLPLLAAPQEAAQGANRWGMAGKRGAWSSGAHRGAWPGMVEGILAGRAKRGAVPVLPLPAAPQEAAQGANRWGMAGTGHMEFRGASGRVARQVGSSLRTHGRGTLNMYFRERLEMKSKKVKSGA